MYIMTENGWRMLPVKVENHVYERVSYNFSTKTWEPDSATGTLRFMRTEDRLYK